MDDFFKIGETWIYRLEGKEKRERKSKVLQETNKKYSEAPEEAEF